MSELQFYALLPFIVLAISLHCGDIADCVQAKPYRYSGGWFSDDGCCDFCHVVCAG